MICSPALVSSSTSAGASDCCASRVAPSMSTFARQCSERRSAASTVIGSFGTGTVACACAAGAAAASLFATAAASAAACDWSLATAEAAGAAVFSGEAPEPPKRRFQKLLNMRVSRQRGVGSGQAHASHTCPWCCW